MEDDGDSKNEGSAMERDDALFEQVAAVVERYCDAVHTQDEDTFKALWTGDDANTEIAGSKVFRGLDAIYDDFLAGLIRGTYASITLVNDGLEVSRITDDVAVAVFRYHTECVRRDTGEPYGIAGVETQVLRLEGGTWRLVHVQYHGKPV
jgi:uncharacterized protein (TIGR02246 family)